MKRSSNGFSADGKKNKKKWSASEKFRVVVETSALSEKDKGDLPRGGLYEPQVRQWREAAELALAGAPERDRAGGVEAKKPKLLERELTRKDRALAEAAALLVLKKSRGDLGD
jgi:hypothetical protein